MTIGAVVSMSTTRPVGVRGLVEECVDGDRLLDVRRRTDDLAATDQHGSSRRYRHAA